VARRKEGIRVLGPYEYGDRWRIFEVSPNGETERQARYFKSKKEAIDYKKEFEQALEDPGSVGMVNEKDIDVLAALISERVVGEIRTMFADGGLPARSRESEWPRNERNTKCTSTTNQSEADGEYLLYKQEARDILSSIRQKRKRGS